MKPYIFYSIWMGVLTLGAFVPVRWMGVYLVIALAILLNACGDSEPQGYRASDSSGLACENSPLVGTWHFGTRDDLTFEPDCSFRSRACQMSGSYPNTLLSSGTVRINVRTSLGLDQKCFPSGSVMTCRYSRVAEVFDIDCDPYKPGVQ